MIPVEGHKGLYRDEKTGAIINCDITEYNRYIALKNQKINQKNEIENLKNELSEIKDLLHKLLNEKH
jgi:hypothetical protein